MPYRKMTAEEKLAFSAEIINAIKEDGLEGSLKVVEEYERKLSTTEEIIEAEELNEKNVPNSEIPAPVSPVEAHKIANEIPKEASIYASEHIRAVEKDKVLTSQETSVQVSHAKTRTLTNPSIPSAHQTDENRSNTPSMYQDAVVVEPGYFNNTNKML